MLAVLFGLIGLAALIWGTTHYVRSRLSPQLQDRRELHRRIALGAAGVGGVTLLAPDAIAGLLLGSGEGGSLAALGWVLYRLLALGVIGIAALTMGLSSDPVTAKVRRGRDRVVAVAPMGIGRQTRRMRRSLGQFPAEWQGLLEHDRALTRRLLAYQRDAEVAAARPTMADLASPHTKTAVDAMFRCDTLRTMQPPARVHDILATEYGQAVAAFDRALADAERHADERVAGAVTTAEQKAVMDATRTLSFLQSTATTPQERSAAYNVISERLAQASATAESTPAESARGANAWLSVEERARAEG